MIRLFVGIGLPEDIRARLSGSVPGDSGCDDPTPREVMRAALSRPFSRTLATLTARSRDSSLLSRYRRDLMG